jgi:hypothetical protein
VKVIIVCLWLLSLGGCATFICNPCIDVYNPVGEVGMAVFAYSALLASSLYVVDVACKWGSKR